MMKFKKFLAAAMTGAMMLGTVTAAVPAMYVYAADTAITVNIDYEKFTATVSGGADGEAYFCLEVLKDEKGSKSSAIYYYPVAIATAGIDLSFLKATKTQYIRVSSVKNPDLSTITTVNPQPAKLKAKYNATKTALNERLALTSGKDTVELSKYNEYQFRTLYAADWSTDKLNDIALDNYTTAGTTLVIRKAAVNGSDAKVNAPAGAEIKVKIPALAKAPKTSIDYGKGLISLPKGTEIRLSDSTDPNKYVPIGDSAAKLSPAELLGKLNVADTDIDTKIASGFTVVVRTAKTDKKPASNVAFLNVPAAPAISATGATPPALPTTATATITAKASSDASAAAIDGKVTITKTYDMSKGVGYSFEVEDANFDFSLDEGKSWTTVKAGKNYTVYSEDKAQVLQIRRSASKTETLLQSNVLEFNVPAKAATPIQTENNGTITIKGQKGTSEVTFTVKRVTTAGDNLGKIEIAGSNVSDFECLDGDEWKAVAATGSNPIGSKTEVYTMTIRLKAVPGSETVNESDPITITVALPTT